MCYKARLNLTIQLLEKDILAPAPIPTPTPKAVAPLVKNDKDGYFGGPKETPFSLRNPTVEFTKDVAFSKPLIIGVTFPHAIIDNERASNITLTPDSCRAVDWALR